MKKIINCLVFLNIILLLSACKNTPSANNEQQTTETYEYRVPQSYTPAPTDSAKSQSQTKETSTDKTNISPTDTYDDGYQDGEAMAEEDRLAGKPGMQIGIEDDEDDDDYEDGYDDGYDE